MMRLPEILTLPHPPHTSALTMPDVPLSSAALSNDSNAMEIVRDSPDWTEGDFSLISSDGWRYRVRSAKLCRIR